MHNKTSGVIALTHWELSEELPEHDIRCETSIEAPYLIEAFPKDSAHCRKMIWLMEGTACVWLNMSPECPSNNVVSAHGTQKDTW